MQRKSQSGFSVIGLLLAVIVLGLVGYAGYYVGTNKDDLTNTYNTTNQDDSETGELVTDSTQEDYDNCVSAEGSRILETHPPQCMTKDGKTYATSELLPVSADEIALPESQE